MSSNMESTGTSLKEGRREYLWQLNVIRFISAVMVLLFHIHANLPVDFHALRPLVSNVAPWMTTFFILSGFILDYNYNGRDFFEGDNLFSFWKKRFFSIYPMYVMVWVFFYVIFTQSITATDFYTLPSQILMIHSTRYENAVAAAAPTVPTVRISK